MNEVKRIWNTRTQAWEEFVPAAELADLKARLSAIERAAEDATEYVLAQINADLRARLAEAERLLDAWARLQWAMFGPDPMWELTVQFLGAAYTGRNAARAAETGGKTHE